MHQCCTRCYVPPPLFLFFHLISSHQPLASPQGSGSIMAWPQKNKFVPLAIYGHQYSRCSWKRLIGRDRSCTQSHTAHVLSPSTVQSLISGGRVGFSDRPRRKLIIQPTGRKKTVARKGEEEEGEEDMSGQLGLHD